MPLIIVCSGCRAEFRVKDEYASRKVRCPSCKTVFTATVAPQIEINSEPPPGRPARRDEDDDGRGHAPRRDRTPSRDEEDSGDAEAPKLHEWAQWADRHVRKYILWVLLPSALVVGLVAVVLMVKPIQKPGLESLWAVLALLSVLQLATCVGFVTGADWPFGTLITVAPIVISNMLLRLVRAVNPAAGSGGFASQVWFLVAAAGTLAIAWWWLQRQPARSSMDRILHDLDKAHPQGVLEELLNLGQFLRVAVSAVTLVTMRFQTQPHRRTQLLIGLGGGSLAYVVFLLLTVTLIGTKESRERLGDGAGTTPNATEKKQDLQYICLTYHLFHDDKKLPPRDADELSDYDTPATRETRPRTRAALKSGNYVVIWNAKISPEPDQQTGVILGYHKDAPEKGGGVCFMNGEFATLTRDQFSLSQKAKGASD